ncbi:CHRD domain-containing protein [Phaeodactylibacter xiamenensis]|uniref:CHRD domain-containing protein n=1 Tax=Phaeodactylibacter xiamenensis TaxID=1524460 RepID=UPI003CCC0CA4
MKIRDYLFLLLVFCSLPFTGSAQMTFTAELSGRNEATPIVSRAFGEITAVLDGNELAVSGSFTGLEGNFDVTVAGGSHIHTGYAGENGGITFELSPNLGILLKSGTFEATSNTFTLSAEEMDALMERRMYVNIHTTLYPGGEIRGQLLPEGNNYLINLSGSNEVPSVSTDGHGALALDVVGDQLTVTGSFADLEGNFDASVLGGAHLHLALPGQNGDVDIQLNATTNPDLKGGVFTAADNTFGLEQSQIEALENRLYYANIHTTAYGAGELRGQVASTAASTVLRAHLSGSNEQPAVTSYATGVVQAEVIEDSLIVYGSFTGLESEVATDIAGGAHIHTGLAGENGPVTFALTSDLENNMTEGTFEAASNRFALTPDDLTAIYDRGFYVNIHSVDQQAGEIRGQLLPEAPVYFTAVLGGGFEAPPVTTRAFGAVKAELRGNMLTVSGSFSELSSAVDVSIVGGAHLHVGLPGENGPVEFPLAIDLNGDLNGGTFDPVDNTFELTEEQVMAVMNRSYYVNIHTLTNGGGELRGQLLGEARYYMNAALSGTSEVPAVNTPATGQVLMEVRSDNIIIVGSFSGLSSLFDAAVAGGAHLHSALAGSNGGIEENLSSDIAGDGLSGAFPAADNVVPSTEALRSSLRNRGLYVNIHTEDFQSGELRGQTLPFATAYFTTSLDAFNEVPVAVSPAVGGLKLELNGDQLTVTGAFSGLTDEFDPNIGGGAHLHLGAPGENGGVDIVINAMTASDNLSGTFMANNNTFTLSEEQVVDLIAGNYYANIHTMAYPGGELRGQILQQSNFFPVSAPMINFPPDGADFLLEGGATTDFSATWSAATDDSQLAYVWQLSTDADFEDIVFQQNVGNNTEFVTDFETVDGLLGSLGVDVGTEVTVYHRAVATDGAVATAGAAYAVNITRGEVMEDLFEATLSGHNEALPILSTATGFVSASLSGNELTVSGGFEGLSSKIAEEIAGGAHLHAGFAGENGPVLYPLNIEVSTDSLSGAFLSEDNVFTLSDEEVAMLRNREMYVNIHSDNFGGGELRGQLTPVSEAIYTMSLLGSNEVPSAVTSGQGALVLEVANGELTVSGAFSGLESDFDADIAGGAHLHIGQAGENGGIEIGLNADVDAELRSGVFRAEDNTFTLTEDQRVLLNNRSLYANIHTADFPAGELRGQLAGTPRAVFRAHLSGANEAPAVTSMAGGAVVAELMNDSTIVVSGSFSGLESALNTDIAGGAHIHMGLPGENGDVIFPLNVTDEGGNAGRFLPSENTFTINEDQLEAMMSRGLYVNIHSLDQPSGEIRGQLMLESQVVFTGYLSGIFEVPEAATEALGAVQAELSGNRMTLAGTFAGLSSPVATDIAGGAHIHAGYAGQTGDVVIPLAVDLDSDNLGGTFAAMPNTYQLEEDQIELMKDRGLYVNIHSTDIQSGELRAQVLPEARTYFYAPLSGASEVPAVNTEAVGALALEVNPGRITATGSFNALSSMLETDIAGGAHIHLGYAGENGGVQNVLGVLADANGTNGIFPAADNTNMASEGWIDTLRMRQYYVNVHSMDFPSGEVRGQLLPLSTTYFTSSLSGFNEVQPIGSEAVGGIKVELTGETLTLTGAFSGLESPFDENVAGGAHLHLGGPGMNGDVDLGLMPTIDADQTSGAFTAADNTYALTAEQVEAIRSGSYYVNIHTEEQPAGELRGQVLPEINRFPSDEAEITAPMDGAALTIEGDPETPFAATWSEASDRDDLVYIWQLASEEDFTEVLVQQNVGAEQTFETTFGVVDQILEDGGIAINQTVTLYHRAVASDGSVATPGGFSTVEVTRGMITSTLDVAAAGLGMKAFPTVTRNNLTVEMSSQQTRKGQLMVHNGNGQAVHIVPVELSSGTTVEQLDVRQMPAGTYFLRLIVEGQQVATRRFIVE